MGVNMRIFHCYGVKVEKLDSIPEDKKEEYYDNFCDELYNKPCIFGDCYSGEWEFFGNILESTHDYRYDGWATFEWKIENEEYQDIIDLCENYGLEKPSHYVITYFS